MRTPICSKFFPQLLLMLLDHFYSVINCIVSQKCNHGDPLGIMTLTETFVDVLSLLLLLLATAFLWLIRLLYICSISILTHCGLWKLKLVVLRVSLRFLR